MNCPYCGTSTFRLSHLRLTDFSRLILLRFPVRCRLCRERFYVFLSTAMSVRRLHRQHIQEKVAFRNENEVAGNNGID